MPLFLPYFSTIFPAKPVENVDNLFYVNITSCYRIYYVNFLSDKTRHAQ